MRCPKCDAPHGLFSCSECGWGGRKAGRPTEYELSGDKLRCMEDAVPAAPDCVAQEWTLDLDEARWYAANLIKMGPPHELEGRMIRALVAEVERQRAINFRLATFTARAERADVASRPPEDDA